MGHQHDDADSHRAESHNSGAGQGSPVLDIGGEVGALVLLTPAALKGREIELSLVDQPDRRTHVEVLERHVGASTVCAAVYGSLPQGRYRIWDDTPGWDHEVDVIGGQVTQLDWT